MGTPSATPEPTGPALPPAVRHAVDAFQRYVCDRYSHRAAWPDSRKLIQAVADALAIRVGGGPPIDPRSVAKSLSIDVRFRDGSPDESCGELIPVHGGFRASVVGGDSVGERLRTRFTVAHECGHSLFFRCDERRVSWRIVPRQVVDRRSIQREEGLCDAFAGALLVPADLLARRIPAHPRLTSLLAAASYFAVAPEVVARRVLYECRMWPNTVLYQVLLGRSPLTVRAFRGVSQRSADAQAPSARALAGIVRGDTRMAVVEAFQRAFPGAGEAKAYATSTLWLML